MATVNQAYFQEGKIINGSPEGVEPGEKGNTIYDIENDSVYESLGGTKWKQVQKGGIMLAPRSVETIEALQALTDTTHDEKFHVNDRGVSGRILKNKYTNKVDIFCDPINYTGLLCTNFKDSGGADDNDFVAGDEFTFRFKVGLNDLGPVDIFDVQTYKGAINPTGDVYPDTTNSLEGDFWEANADFTYTSGSLSGAIISNEDTLVYDGSGGGTTGQGLIHLATGERFNLFYLSTGSQSIVQFWNTHTFKMIWTPNKFDGNKLTTDNGIEIDFTTIPYDTWINAWFKVADGESFSGSELSIGRSVDVISKKVELSNVTVRDEVFSFSEGSGENTVGSNGSVLARKTDTALATPVNLNWQEDEPSDLRDIKIDSTTVLRMDLARNVITPKMLGYKSELNAKYLDGYQEDGSTVYADTFINAIERSEYQVDFDNGIYCLGAPLEFINSQLLYLKGALTPSNEKLNYVSPYPNKAIEFYSHKQIDLVHVFTDLRIFGGYFNTIYCPYAYDYADLTALNAIVDKEEKVNYRALDTGLLYYWDGSSFQTGSRTVVQDLNRKSAFAYAGRDSQILGGSMKDVIIEGLEETNKREGGGMFGVFFSDTIKHPVHPGNRSFREVHQLTLDYKALHIHTALVISSDTIHNDSVESVWATKNRFVIDSWKNKRAVYLSGYGNGNQDIKAVTQAAGNLTWEELQNPDMHGQVHVKAGCAVEMSVVDQAYTEDPEQGTGGDQYNIDGQLLYRPIVGIRDYVGCRLDGRIIRKNDVDIARLVVEYVPTTFVNQRIIQADDMRMIRGFKNNTHGFIDDIENVMYKADLKGASISINTYDNLNQTFDFDDNNNAGSLLVRGVDDIALSLNNALATPSLHTRFFDGDTSKGARIDYDPTFNAVNKDFVELVISNLDGISVGNFAAKTIGFVLESFETAYPDRIHLGLILETPITITSNGSIATVTLVGHGFASTNKINIACASEVGYSGNHEITVLDVDTFTFPTTVNNAAVLDGFQVNTNRTRSYDANYLKRQHYEVEDYSKDISTSIVIRLVGINDTSQQLEIKSCYGQLYTQYSADNKALNIGGGQTIYGDLDLTGAVNAKDLNVAERAEVLGDTIVQNLRNPVVLTDVMTTDNIAKAKDYLNLILGNLWGLYDRGIPESEKYGDLNCVSFYNNRNTLDDLTVSPFQTVTSELDVVTNSYFLKMVASADVDGQTVATTTATTVGDFYRISYDAIAPIVKIQKVIVNNGSNDWNQSILSNEWTTYSRVLQSDVANIQVKMYAIFNASLGDIGDELYVRNLKVEKVDLKTLTGTEISLDYITGRSYNLDGVAIADLVYTTTDLVESGKAKCLINTVASSPTITGATQRTSKGDAWVTATDMYMFVEYDGTTVEYWFELKI